MVRSFHVAAVVLLARCLGFDEDEPPHLQLARWDGAGPLDVFFDRQLGADCRLGVADVDGDAIDEVLCGSRVFFTDGGELTLDARAPIDIAALSVGGVTAVALLFEEPESVAIFTCAGGEDTLECASADEIATVERSRDIAAADLDGDGNDELFAWSGRGIAMHRLEVGAGTTSLAPATLILPSYMTVEGAPGALAAGDVDADGAIDLAFGAAKSVQIAYGDGAGGFPREDLVPASTTATYDVDWVVLGDVDGNGLLDPATSLETVLRQRAPGDFEIVELSPLETSFLLPAPIFADFDGNGRIEIVGLGGDDTHVDFGLLTFEYDEALGSFTRSFSALTVKLTGEATVATGRFDRNPGLEIAVFSGLVSYAAGC